MWTNLLAVKVVSDVEAVIGEGMVFRLLAVVGSVLVVGMVVEPSVKGGEGGWLHLLGFSFLVFAG